MQIQSGSDIKMRSGSEKQIQSKAIFNMEQWLKQMDSARQDFKFRLLNMSRKERNLAHKKDNETAEKTVKQVADEF